MEKITIVKVGGAVVEDEAQLTQLLKDFAAIEGKKYLYMAEDDEPQKWLQHSALRARWSTEDVSPMPTCSK